MSTLLNESRLFSEKLNSRQSKLFTAIRQGSVSDQDAKIRVNAYQKLFDNYSQYKQVAKQFSSYAESDILANQYFNANVAAVAKSIIGFLGIERTIDQPNSLIYYLDLLDISGSTVMPNIGPDNLALTSRNRLNATATPTGASQTITLGEPIIPGTVSITITLASVVYTYTDDKQGNLVGSIGGISAGTVSYSGGTITLDTVSAAVGDTIVAKAVSNQTGDTPNVNRFKTDLKEYRVDTYPELLIGESNIASLAAMQKSIGIDLNVFMAGKLQELYTKMINAGAVSEIVNGYVGNTIQIDPNNGGVWQDYRSTIEAFVGGLTEVDSELASKSFKGCRATAYVVGKNVVTYFRNTRILGVWTEANNSYVNDLVGFLNGIPVIEHLDISDNFGYAVHKTVDGQLAPIARSMFLPLTATPVIGNYQNPTQLASGVYYQERESLIVPELVQQFEIV